MRRSTGAGTASKDLRESGLSSPGRLLGVLISALMLSGCPAGHGCLLCSPPTYGLGGTVSGLAGSRLVLQNNGDANDVSDIAYAANGTYPDLFGGYAQGTAYNVTVQTQPTNPSQTCVVANGTGTLGASGVTNISVTCTTNPARFLYVVNGGSNNISAYTIDTTSGALTTIAGSPFSAGNNPDSINVDPTGKFAFVTNRGDSTISAFTIDRASGMLAPVSGSPFATGPAPTSIAIDASSSFVYVSSGTAGTVSAYAITPISGALTPVTGSPFAAGSAASSVTIDPLNMFVYVA